jgi:hypothetical protein
LLTILLPPVSCIYTILTVELMLQWNRVSDVYSINSTGQLIPLIVALAGSLEVFLKIRDKYQVRTSK